jgi:predicted dehydrogenase
VVDVVCAGAGWATGERHLPALVRDDRVRVLGVIDHHLERAVELARRHGLPAAGTSLDEEWAASAVCLTVGTPPWAHGDHVQAALERGWHCLCEKPFVLPSSRGRELAASARERGLVLAVVHNFQFSTACERLLGLVESGRLGAIESVYGFQLSNHRRRLPHWYADLPGGLFTDEAPHLLYLIRRVLGSIEPRTVDTRLRGTEIRDLVATFAHGDVWATLTMNFNASVSEWSFVVVGERGVGIVDLFRDVLMLVPNDEGHRPRNVLRSSAALVGGHVAGFASSGVRLARGRLFYGNDAVARRFVDAVLGDRRRIEGMTADDGVAVVACLEALLEGAGVDPGLEDIVAGS